MREDERKKGKRGEITETKVGEMSRNQGRESKVYKGRKMR